MSGNVYRLRPGHRPWNLAEHAKPGVRFATPEQFLDGLPQPVRDSMVKGVVTEALAEAADAQGELLDFSLPRFFNTYMTAVLNQGVGDDEQAPPLLYDRFTAMTLFECLGSLVLDDGLLAHRGNGDSADYRLTLPLA